MSTANAASLEEDLEAAYDGAEGEEDAEGVEPEAEAEESAEAAPEEGAEGGEAAEAEATDESEQPGIEAPQHWKAEYRETFNKLPADAQQFLLERHRDMEADYTRKTQEIADFRREYDTVAQMVAPHAQGWQMQGMSPIQGLQQLLGWKQAMDTDPAGAIQHLAQVSGVDLQKLIEDAPYVDPRTQELEQRLQAMQAQMQQATTLQQQQQQHALLDGIRAFETTADENGAPRYPHAARVWDQMTALVQSGRAQGNTIPEMLASAYEQAVWSDPELRSEMLAQQQRAEASRKSQQAAKAKRASVNPKGKGDGASAVSNSLEDDIASVIDDLS